MEDQVEYHINQIKVLDIIDDNGKDQYVVFKIYKDEKNNTLIKIVNIFDDYYEADSFKNKIFEITGIKLDLAETGKFEICNIGDFPNGYTNIKRFNININFKKPKDGISDEFFSIIKMLSGMPIETQEIKIEKQENNIEGEKEVNFETVKVETVDEIEKESI